LPRRDGGFHGIPQAARSDLRHGVNPLGGSRQRGGCPASVTGRDNDLTVADEHIRVRPAELELDDEPEPT